MSKTAFITGISGQDGSHLADLLLSKGYKIYALIRRHSSRNPWRIEHILDKINLIEGDITDQGSIIQSLIKSKPDEIYNLASQSFVKASWDQPVLTQNITGTGALNVFEAARAVAPDARIYQASSSEMFGQVTEMPQNENTRFYPRSPYGCSKCFAHYSAINNRESYKQYISCGILFNHEGERRGIEFVTRKISSGVAMISEGLKDKIILGNIDAKRDWGYAPDYCEAIWLMLQQDTPDDYVVGTGEAHSVKEFIIAAFEAAGINNWESHIGQDPQFMRPADVNILLADYSKIRNNLGWKPKTKFKELVKIMVEKDIERIQRGEKLL